MHVCQEAVYYMYVSRVPLWCRLRRILIILLIPYRTKSASVTTDARSGYKRRGPPASTQRFITQLTTGTAVGKTSRETLRLPLIVSFLDIQGLGLLLLKFIAEA